MGETESVGGPTGPDPIPRGTGVWPSISLFAVALVVSVPAYVGLESHALTIAYRFGLPTLWIILMATAMRNERLKRLLPVTASLLGVSLGLGLAYIVGDRPLEWFGLWVETPRGASVAKLSEAIPVSASILVIAALTGRGMRALGLGRGRLGLSLGLGLVFAAPLLLFVVLVPGTGFAELRTTSATTILSWVPWILLFSVANGFNEELWFRGSWMGTFGELIGPRNAMHVTSLAFSALHVIVYWRQPASAVFLWPVFLYVGYGCAFIVRRTGSLWGAVLGHVLADFMFVLSAFAGD